MTILNTKNPYALRYLINDTIYKFNIPVESKQILETSTTYQYLGENQKHILYIVSNDEQQYFSPEALSAFSKTIGALGLSMGDVAVLNVSQQNSLIDFDQITVYFNPHKIIFSGVSPAQFGLSDLSLNNAITMNNIRLLYTFSFEEMLYNTDKKKIFWQQVKTL